MGVIVGIFLFILGSCIASFVGVVIYRIPNHMSIVKPDSFCPSCNTPLKWYDNIPIISYICLGGKCRYCNAKIGIDSLLLEILGGVLFLLAFLRFKVTWDLLFVLVIISLFMVIAGIDFKTHDIYDLSQIIYVIITIGYVIYRVLYLKHKVMTYVIGGIVGFVFFLLIRIIGQFVFHKEALGLGDVFLMGISGLLLGWGPLILALLIGSLTGSIIELTLIGLKKKQRDSEIAFGPYLLLGTLIALLYGDIIIDFYLGLVM